MMFEKQKSSTAGVELPIEQICAAEVNITMLEAGLDMSTLAIHLPQDSHVYSNL